MMVTILLIGLVDLSDILLQFAHICVTYLVVFIELQREC